MGMLTSPSPF